MLLKVEWTFTFLEHTAARQDRNFSIMLSKPHNNGSWFGSRFLAYTMRSTYVILSNIHVEFRFEEVDCKIISVLLWLFSNAIDANIGSSCVLLQVVYFL